MVTDTAFLRNVHYHQTSDTPEKLDYRRMADVTVGLERAIRSIGEQRPKTHAENGDSSVTRPF